MFLRNNEAATKEQQKKMSWISTVRGKKNLFAKQHECNVRNPIKAVFCQSTQKLKFCPTSSFFALPPFFISSCRHPWDDYGVSFSPPFRVDVTFLLFPPFHVFLGLSRLRLCDIYFLRIFCGVQIIFWRRLWIFRQIQALQISPDVGRIIEPEVLLGLGHFLALLPFGGLPGCLRQLLLFRGRLLLDYKIRIGDRSLQCCFLATLTLPFLCLRKYFYS